MFKKTLFNLMLSLLGWTFFAMGSSKDCLILEKDGKIIAENQFFSLLFEPKNGGSITSFLYHGKNLTMKVPGEGILQDLFWEEMSEREFQKNISHYFSTANYIAFWGNIIAGRVQGSKSCMGLGGKCV